MPGLKQATEKLKAQGLKKGGFPDLSGDGKITQKDKIDNARIESQEDIAQLRANVNLKKSKPSTNFIKDGWYE